MGLVWRGLVWRGLVWLRLGSSEESCEWGDEPSGYI
jgi:hypothetical protein